MFSLFFYLNLVGLSGVLGTPVERPWALLAVFAGKDGEGKATS